MARRGGGGAKGKGGGGGSGRKYVRDNAGRFASTGTGATARGGRLKTAAGNKRATQTIQAGSRAGVIGKPAGLKPGSIKPKAAAPAPAPKAKIATESKLAATGARAKKVEIRRYLNESDRSAPTRTSPKESYEKRSAAEQRRMARASATATRAKEFLRNYGTPSTFARRPVESTKTSPKFGTKARRRR